MGRARDELTLHVSNAGEDQIMSAGSGATHSGDNNPEQVDVNFLKIWVFPKDKNITPRYGHQLFQKSDRLNRFQTLVSPDRDSNDIWISQEAWFSTSALTPETSINDSKHRVENGLYVFMDEGSVEVLGSELARRDGLGLIDVDSVRSRPRA